MRTIYHNGVVYTGSLPLAEAFAVEGDSFLFAGSSAEALAMAESGSQVIDLEGRFVCSGFNDSHMHLLNYGSALQTAPLSAHTGSLAEMLDCLRDFEAAHPHTGGAWLVGRGWNQDYFSDTDQLPSRWDLDKACADVPVCAVRACGHCLTVNSKALEVLGVTAESPQPEGGRIGMENGQPDGRFYDNAMEMVYDAIPVPDKEALKGMIRAACKALNAYGVTSSQTDDYCVFRKVPWETVNAAYQELEAAGELTVRVYEQSNFTDLPSLRGFVEAGCRTGVGTDRFKIGPLKMLGDGALGPHTAYLSRPYADDASTCGIPVFTQETMDEMIGYANEQGMQAAVHAIGDACLDNVISAYEKALAEHPRKDHRHGVVHCQIMRPDQMEKIEALGLHIYAQTIFLDYDSRVVETRVGKELASTSYAWKSLMKRGVSVSNGTDCPVELPDVMACIQCAVTRMPLRGDIPPYLPEEAFTVQEALDSYTIQGAKASFEENRKGRIQPGMLADFVVLEQNPFETAPEQLKDVKIFATYVGGEKVFG